jgi:hypothetical protein
MRCLPETAHSQPVSRIRVRINIESAKIRRNGWACEDATCRQQAIVMIERAGFKTGIAGATAPAPDVVIASFHSIDSLRNGHEQL